MKRRLLLLVAWVVPVFFTPSVAHARDLTLFIVAGQSNAQGWKGNAAYYPADPNGDDAKIPFFWSSPTIGNSNNQWVTLAKQTGLFPAGHFGPEITFARKVLENGGAPAIFKYTLGSTSIATNWKGPGDHGMYNDMVVSLRNAVAQLVQRNDHVSYGAFIWIQGESDAQNKVLAEAYEERLRKIILDVRNQVTQQPSLPVILGLDEQHPWVKANPQVITAQEDLARQLPACVRTNMLGLQKADGTHLTPQALVSHGERLYDAYATLRGQTK